MVELQYPGLRQDPGTLVCTVMFDLESCSCCIRTTVVTGVVQCLKEFVFRNPSKGETSLCVFGDSNSAQHLTRGRAARSFCDYQARSPLGAQGARAPQL